MRKQILATATALTLAAGLTTSAMAFETDSSSRHSGQFRAGAYGGMHGPRGRHISRYAGVRGFESRRHGGWNYGGPSYRGGLVDLGPLGITTAACGHGYCGPGYGPYSYGTPIDAWSR